MDPRPCLSIADLWEWKPPGSGPPRTELCIDEGDSNLPCHPVAVPPIDELQSRFSPRRLPQLLVCHDFKGDYPICERWEGCETADCPPLLFTHWWHMDAFCYFGHKMVTIPPPSYTSIAHRHGVRVMGTIIFEHDLGRKNLSEMVATDENLLRSVDQLVQIMQTWKFDGWLINVEVDIMYYEVPMLIIFVRKLVAATKKIHPTAVILWYDAVCNDGRLDWQNCLNARNRDFYNACDGIFLNYGWNMRDLEDSRFNEGAASVCVGIDVYGRSGGTAGWDYHEPATKILRKGLSVAVFAPGWAIEAHENALEGVLSGTPELNSFRFWSSMADLVDSRPLDYLPFKTTFKNGMSQEGKFFRLRDSDLMPHFALSTKKVRMFARMEEDCSMDDFNSNMMPTEHGLLVKGSGKQLLWVVKLESNPNLRVKIRAEGGHVKVRLDRREMEMVRMEEDGTMELKPLNNEYREVRGIFVETTDPNTLITYFEAFEVGMERRIG